MQERKNKEKENDVMLEDKICILREKLNKCISDGEDYSVIYKVSVELDDLIAQYYSNLRESYNQ